MFPCGERKQQNFEVPSPKMEVVLFRTCNNTKEIKNFKKIGHIDEMNV